MEKFGSKPKRAGGAKDLVVKSNFFKLSFNNGVDNMVFKYNISFEPEIPEDSKKVRQKVVGSVRKELTTSIGQFKYIGNSIYSLQNSEEELESIGKFETTDYKVKIRCVQIIGPKDNERYTFIKILFNSLLKKLDLQQIGRSYYSPSNSVTLSAHDISVWPGFISGLKSTDQGVLINVDVSHRVLRHETVLQRLIKLKSSRENIINDIVNKTVITKYNQKTYKVTDIDFSLTPKNEFSMKDGSKVSYIDYYSKKYGLTITNLDQPLLVHENTRTAQKVLLIPEFCATTGLTDDMRTNFRLMKDLSKLTNVSSDKRLKECQDLFKIMNQSSECQEEIKRWNLQLEDNPIEIPAKRLDAGKLLMGGSQGKIQIDPINDDIDRKIQTSMFSQPEINCWGIFCPEQDKRNCTKFLDCLKQSINTFRYKMSPPKIFYVKSKFLNDWKDILKKSLGPKVQYIIMLLPGNKQNNPLYNDLKSMLISELPVPSQVVLSNTISRGKNLRSICNKILIQI